MGRQNPLPTLKTVLDARIKHAMAGMNCISIGTIEAFDSVTQTATVSINYKRIIKDVVDIENGMDTQDKIEEYPLLVKCPVFILTGGTATLTMPIAKSDTCILLFCDREIDSWFANGSVTYPSTTRTHDLNDAIAVVGIRSMANAIKRYNTVHVHINHDDGKIVLTADAGVDIETSNVNITGNLSVGSGFTGTFTTGSGEIVTAANGIIINID